MYSSFCISPSSKAFLVQSKTNQTPLESKADAADISLLTSSTRLQAKSHPVADATVVYCGAVVVPWHLALISIILNY